MKRNVRGSLGVSGGNWDDRRAVDEVGGVRTENCELSHGRSERVHHLCLLAHKSLPCACAR